MIYFKIELYINIKNNIQKRFRRTLFQFKLLRQYADSIEKVQSLENLKNDIIRTNDEKVRKLRDENESQGEQILQLKMKIKKLENQNEKISEELQDAQGKKKNTLLTHDRLNALYEWFPHYLFNSGFYPKIILKP